MFAGHVGAALMLGRCERRVNVGFLVLGALAPDLILWALVVAGLETAAVPADYARRRYLVFEFPYSHGLAASIAWSALAAWLAWAATRAWLRGRGRAAAVVGAAVFSHWILDALVHRAELPVLGAGSRLVGLGLWDHLALALTLESAIALLGLLVFISGVSLPAGRVAGLSVVVLAVVAMTILGMTLAPPPSDMRQAAFGSIAVVAAVSLLAGWLGSGRGVKAEA